MLRNPVVSWQEAPRRAAAGAGALVDGTRAPCRRLRVSSSTHAWSRPWPPRTTRSSTACARSMAEQELDALVVRAPDNVLYLTNFWGMKGYDAVVFPREGEPVLICLEPRRATPSARRWTSDVRLFARLRRARPAAAAAARARPRAPGARRVRDGSASSSRSARRRPTGWSASRRPSRRRGSTRSPTPPTRRRSSPRPARSRPTQEVERMRLANEIAAAAMEHVQGVLRPGMTRERGGGDVGAASSTATGTGWARARSSSRYGFSLVWSGPGIRTFTATGNRPVAGGRADAVRDLGLRRRLLVRPHEEPRPRRARRRGTRELEERLLGRVRRRRRRSARPGACLAELDRRVRDGLAAIGYPGQPSHPICHGVGARAHEPPYAHQAGGGEVEEGMVLAIEPGVYWPEGGGLRVEDNFLITASGAEKLCRFPDGIVRRHDDRPRQDLDGRAERARARAAAARHGRPLRHDAARRRADRRRRPHARGEARDRPRARRGRRRPDRGRLPARLGGGLPRRSS